jgi:hypothetical protein
LTIIIKIQRATSAMQQIPLKQFVLSVIDLLRQIKAQKKNAPHILRKSDKPSGHAGASILADIMNISSPTHVTERAPLFE